jgi:Heterokaryon incompatibility protein Het-C
MGSEEDEKLNHGEELKQQAQGYHFDPNNVAPPKVQQQLKDLLKWHDDVMRDIDKKISKIPGLSNLLEELSNALNEYIYTILAPYLTVSVYLAQISNPCLAALTANSYSSHLCP